MDFTLTDDQRFLVDSVSALLGGACPPALVRAVAEGDRDAARLAPLADFVAVGDGPVTDHVLVAERVGRSCAPGTWFVASALALPLLRAAGHELADAVAAGERAATVAWAGAQGDWAVPPSSEPERTFVLELDLADEVVVVRPEGVAVVAAGAGRRTSWLDLSRTAWELGGGDGPVAAVPATTLSSILQRGTVVLAAELFGTARAMLDMAVAYAGERVQFDKPIGSFQAVQHLLADLALDVERAWAGVQWAAMCLDDPDAAGLDATRAPHVAKAAASEAAAHAVRTSIQVHGGIGYTWEHDAHLFYKRLLTLQGLGGGSTDQLEELATIVLD
jgi:alkylation response protein AidB-like acyl-CoA dehydrogenase